MSKDYDNWNLQKQAINRSKKTKVYFHAREVWWCSLGINIGTEQDGTGRNFDRPVLILKVFNLNSYIGIALTGKKREGKYYFYLGMVNDREASLVLSQIRLIDSKRLIRKISTIDVRTFEKIKTAVKAVIFN